MSNSQVIPIIPAKPPIFTQLQRNMSFFQGQQIVVMKGWEGFADRLQILSHCLHYCLVHKAAICIDWRDYMWGQETLDFSTYFEIVGIPVVSLSTVLDRMKNGATVSPPAWNLENMATIPNESVHFAQFQSTITNSYGRINAEIIVNNGKGLRMWHIDNLISNIRLKKPIAELISGRLQNLESPFTAIHLRGTDRLSNLSVENAIKPAIDAINLQPPHVISRMYVLSDMNSMINAWIAKFPQSKQLYSDYEIYKLPSGTQGTHQLPKEALEFYKVKKHTMNIDTITDFLIICFSNWSFGNSKESTFTSLAAFMRQGGKIGISKWLHGYQPITKAFI